MLAVRRYKLGKEQQASRCPKCRCVLLAVSQRAYLAVQVRQPIRLLRCCAAGGDTLHRGFSLDSQLLLNRKAISRTLLCMPS